MDGIANYFKSTMLIERLFGVGVYVLALGYFYNKIKHSRNARSISKHLNHYLIVLAVMAFFYIPGEAADLYRWRILAEPWKSVTFKWFWDNRVITKSTPIGFLYIYIFQMTGIDGLLPMVCALGFFGNVFHIIKCEVNREEPTSESVAVALLFFMSSGRFLEVISGIRCMLAFSIVARFMYDELYEKKSIVRSLPFYLIAVLLHSATIPLVGVRLFCSLFEKKRNLMSTLLNVIITVSVFALGLKVGEDYLDAGLDKASSYISNSGYSYLWEYIIATLSLLIIMYLLIELRRRCPEIVRKHKSSIRFVLILLIIQIVTIRTYAIYHRFVAVSTIMCIPSMITFLCSEDAKGKVKSKQNIVLVSLLVLLIASVRGNLCGYKFFLLN